MLKTKLHFNSLRLIITMGVRKCSLILVAVLFSGTLMAQDKIFLKNGEEITAYIIEKSEKRIIYKIMDTDNSPVIVLKTEKVEKIAFRNGDEITLPNLIRMNKRFGVNGGLIYGLSEEAAFFKLGIDYFITPGLSLGLNGLISGEDGGGVEAGAWYFFDPYNPRRFKGYTGLLIGASNDNVFLQVPFGVNYISERGFDFKAGLRGFYNPSISSFSLYSELTLGWRF